MLKTLLSILVFSLLFFFPAFGQDEGPANTEAEFEAEYQERIKKEKLFNIYIPKNLDDAMIQLDKLTPPEGKAVFKALPEDSVVSAMHDRLGRWIMMNWGFYGGSRLSHYLRSAKITYPEDMADFLLLAYHRHLNGKPIPIKDLALEFREKRKKEWENEKKEAKVISETRRKVPKTDKTRQN